MKTNTAIVTTLAAIIFSISSAAAVEQNGLRMDVARKTTERQGKRPGYYSQEKLTQSLKVSFKNISMKPLPEGEVKWTILVDSQYQGSTYKYTGTTPLKALRSNEATDLMIGDMVVGSKRDYFSGKADKVEYQISVTHAGKETMKHETATNFAMLAKRAMTAPKRYEGEEDEEEAPAKPKTDPVKPAPPQPMPPQPVPPRPMPAPTPAPTNPVPPPPVDFFNLDKDKKPGTP